MNPPEVDIAAEVMGCHPRLRSGIQKITNSWIQPSLMLWLDRRFQDDTHSLSSLQKFAGTTPLSTLSAPFCSPERVYFRCSYL